jgi:glyoxylase-like metal-dependent hydrolase (beta-lactamase superfamily II)
MRIELAGHDVVGVRAGNPGPFTHSGTNSWLVGRDPAWLIDPGPALAAHMEAVGEEITRRGGLGGIALTHDHPDHAEALPALKRRFPGVPAAGARGNVDVRLRGGESFGPLEAVATPGHAPDHLSFLWFTVVFTGDAVLGEGSVFIYPDPGALASYLDALSRLRERELTVLAPGHGPPVYAPAQKLEEYILHRRERERRLLEALDAGARSTEELLDRVWDEIPVALRPAATVTLAAHLDKLADEGRLPDRVQRPVVPGLGGS